MVSGFRTSTLSSARKNNLLLFGKYCFIIVKLSFNFDCLTLKLSHVQRDSNEKCPLQPQNPLLIFTYKLLGFFFYFIIFIKLGVGLLYSVGKKRQFQSSKFTLINNSCGFIKLILAFNLMELQRQREKKVHI